MLVGDFECLSYQIVSGYKDRNDVCRSIECLIRGIIKVGARISNHAWRWHIHFSVTFPLSHYYGDVIRVDVTLRN